VYREEGYPCQAGKVGGPIHHCSIKREGICLLQKVVIKTDGKMEGKINRYGGIAYIA
jgi:hypothetical protein